MSKRAAAAVISRGLMAGPTYGDAPAAIVIATSSTTPHARLQRRGPRLCRPASAADDLPAVPSAGAANAAGGGGTRSRHDRRNSRTPTAGEARARQPHGLPSRPHQRERVDRPVRRGSPRPRPRRVLAAASADPPPPRPDPRLPRRRLAVHDAPHPGAAARLPPRLQQHLAPGEHQPPGDVVRPPPPRGLRGPRTLSSG